MRAKFICYGKTESEYGHSVNLRPVHTGSPENEQFYRNTPGGSVELNVVQRGAFEAFNVGTEYYLDFTEAKA